MDPLPPAPVICGHQASTYDLPAQKHNRRLYCTGEVLLGDLNKHGFRITQDSEAVDCVLINTCGFVEDAKAESLEVRLQTQADFCLFQP